MRIMLCAATVLLCACSSSIQSGPAADVTLTATPGTVAAGDSLVLTLDNGTPGQIGYNLCASSLERQTADGWEVVPTDIVCTMELRILEAGQEASYPAALPTPLSPGQYRYNTSVQFMEANEGHRVTSNAFRVTA